MLMPEPGSAAHLRVFRTGTSFNRLLPKVFNVSITGRALSGVVVYFFSHLHLHPTNAVRIMELCFHLLSHKPFSLIHFLYQ